MATVIIEISDRVASEVTLRAKNDATGATETFTVKPSSALDHVFLLYRERISHEGSLTFVNQAGNILHPMLTVSMLKGGGSEDDSVIVRCLPKFDCGSAGGNSADNGAAMSMQVVRGTLIEEVCLPVVQTRRHPSECHGTHVYMAI